MAFAENLRELRRQRNLSQEDLADLLGVSRQAVSKWEQGEGYPEVEKLLALAGELKVSLDSLMGLESARKEPVGKQPGAEGILISSPHENVVVHCCKVAASGRMMGGKSSPHYALFGVSQGGNTFWGEPNTFLGWYREQDAIGKEVEEIYQAILRGDTTYQLRYSVKTRRHWGRITLED